MRIKRILRTKRIMNMSRMNMSMRSIYLKSQLLSLAMAFFALLASSQLQAEEVGAMWGTAEEEAKYYPIVNIPIPKGIVIEAGNFEMHPDGRLIVGTRYGDIYFIDGAFKQRPQPTYHRYATGMDEIFGVTWKKNKDGKDTLYVTQSCELTEVSDANGDGIADRFMTVSDAWGYANYHEYAFGSKFDRDGNLFVALGLSKSYHSWELYRGWALKITPEGNTIPWCSGLRSPGGVNENEHGVMFYTESQGPWNNSCSLKVLKQGGFMGHPRSFNWYKFTDYKTPVSPNSGSRVMQERERVKELVPYAVIFPYIRMGRSISGFTVNRTQGKFGPFENQIFVGDYSQSIIMRATTEKINGVWQGACYPFREGLSTGLLNVQFSPKGQLIAGGTNRGWPVRGIKPYALQRIDWSGKTPFEIKEIKITKLGFKIEFTKPVGPSAEKAENYALSTFTHTYHAGYGGPEVDQTVPLVTKVALSEDKRTATLVIKDRNQESNKGHVYCFDLGNILDQRGKPLLHKHAYYTMNEWPE